MKKHAHWFDASKGGVLSIMELDDLPLRSRLPKDSWVNNE